MNHEEQADQIERTCKRWAEWYSNPPGMDWPEGVEQQASKHLTLNEIEPGTLEELGRRFDMPVKWGERTSRTVGAVIVLTFGGVMFAMHAKDQEGRVEMNLVMEKKA